MLRFLRRGAECSGFDKQWRGLGFCCLIGIQLPGGSLASDQNSCNRRFPLVECDDKHAGFPPHLQTSALGTFHLEARKQAFCMVVLVSEAAHQFG